VSVELAAFYASNVEYYLWQAGTFERWIRNLEALPTTRDAVLIRRDVVELR